MATGRLGVANLSAATNTTVYDVPDSTFAVVTLSICNRSASAVTILSLIHISEPTRPY